MLCTEYFGLTIRLATVVVPIAVYFLVLGLLNSRKHPQLLSSRQDMLLLIMTLSPLVLIPLLDYFGATSWYAIVAAVGGVAVGIRLLVPEGNAWVIYNLPPDQARRAIGRTLQSMGISLDVTGGQFLLPDRQATVQVSGSPLLRNTSIRLRGASRQFARRFEQRLGMTVADMSAQTPSSAIALLLVATAMLVAPLAMVAPRAGEIVRLLTGLLE